MDSPLTQQFSKILFASYPVPYVNEPINFLVGIGEVVYLSLLRCERIHLPLVRNGILLSFIDKISKKRLGSKYGINIFKEDLISQSTLHKTSADLIINFEEVGKHQVTIYDISHEMHSELSSSQSQYVGIIFASIGKIFEPVYIVNLNESISIQSNFVPDRFISNLEKTNLFSNDQLRFISSDLEINAGNKYIFTNKSKQALLKELNRLSLEKSKEPK
jgi:hypothetical protein